MLITAYNADGGLDFSALDEAAAEIRRGGLIGLPTETVYGLAGDARRAESVAAIFAAKGRPSDHPLIVHVAAFDGGIGGVAHFCVRVPAFARQLMEAFWPGPLTLILPRRPGVAEQAAGGQSSVGVRCPAHPVAQALLDRLRDESLAPPVWGLAAPSANRFGRVSPTLAQHVQEELGPQLLVLDGGACRVGIESTIVDCTRGAPVLLRPGVITPAQIMAVCGQALLRPEEIASPAPRASGTLASHYAPRAKVRLMPARQLEDALQLLQAAQVGAESTPLRVAVYHRSVLLTPRQGVLCHRMPTLPQAVAQELFATLRALDAQGVEVIWVEEVPSGPDWDGVRDRLQRAAA